MADAADDSHAAAFPFPYYVATAAVTALSGAALAYYNGWISALPGGTPSEQEREAIIADLLKDGADPSLDDVKKAAKRARSAVREATKKSKSKKHRNKTTAAAVVETSPRKSSARSSATASDDDDDSYYAAAAGDEGDDEDGGSVADLLRLGALSKPKAAPLAQPKERKIKVAAAAKPAKGAAAAATAAPAAVAAKPFAHEPTPILDQPRDFAPEGSNNFEDAAPAADEYIVPAAPATPEVESEEEEGEVHVEVATVVVESVSPLLSHHQEQLSSREVDDDADESVAQRERIRRDELQQVLNETASLRRKVEESATLIGNLRSENSELQLENQQLSQEISEAKRMSAAAQTLQSEMEIIKDSNRMLAQTLSSAQLTAKDANERAARAIKTASSAEDLKATIRNLEQANRDLRSQLDEVTLRLETADARHSDNLHRSTAQANDARKQLEARVEELVREVKAKDARHAEHKSAAARDFDGQKTENRKLLNQLAETKNMAERAVQEAHEQREKANPQIEQLKRRVDELVAQKQAADDKAAASHTQQKEAQAQVEELTRRAEKLAAEKKAAEDKAATAVKAQEQSQTAAKEVDDLKRRIEGLVSEKKAAEDKAAAAITASEQNQKAGDEVEVLKRRIDELLAEKDAADKRAASANEALERETSELHAALEAAAEAGASIKQVKAELNVARAAADQSAKSHASELAAVRADLAAAAEKISSLTAQLETSRAAPSVVEKPKAGDAEFESLRREHDEAIETQARLKKELEATAAKVDIAVTERATIAAAEKEARTALQSALATVKEADASKQALEQQIKDLTAQVEELRTKSSASPTATTETSTAASVTSGSATKPYTFLWKHGGNDVRVTGAFDDWRATDHILTRSADLPTHFSLTLPIPAGTKVPFKYVCDGEWRVDLEAPLEKDSLGVENNIAYVA
ncbi:hypothetical protein HDU88_007249 [Geranomyces variabilis]|nr:hypothetical protein HDU88_007249 [Geranomyces variabilis]